MGPSLFEKEVLWAGERTVINAKIAYEDDTTVVFAPSGEDFFSFPAIGDKVGETSTLAYANPIEYVP